MPDGGETRRNVRASAGEQAASGAQARPATRRTIRERAAERRPGAAQREAGERPTQPVTTASFDTAARALGYESVDGANGVEGPIDRAEPAEVAAGPSPELDQSRRMRRLISAATGAAAIAALVAVGIAMPIAAGGASAESSAVATGTQTFEDGDVQAFVTSEEVENAVIERAEGFTSETLAAALASAAASSGVNTAGAFFENNPKADIQWPFAVGTSMSDGFGQRWGRLHEGVDFTPGAGAATQAIADGIVRTATEAGGAYGVTVVIDHVIDGQVYSTRYAHLEYGSLQVQEGDRVAVGQVVGTVGNTGRSYGAHLHFEVHVNGSSIDPLPWLEQHAGTRYNDEERATRDAALAGL